MESNISFESSELHQPPPPLPTSFLLALPFTWSTFGPRKPRHRRTSNNTFRNNNIDNVKTNENKNNNSHKTGIFSVPSPSSAAPPPPLFDLLITKTNENPTTVVVVEKPGSPSVEKPESPSPEGKTKMRFVLRFPSTSNGKSVDDGNGNKNNNSAATGDEGTLPLRNNSNRRSSRVSGSGKKLNFRVSLTKEERANDLFRMSEGEIQLRPKKASPDEEEKQISMAVQRRLDYLFPGLMLGSITPHSYKLPRIT